MAHYTLKQVRKAIDNAKAQLIKKAKAHGLVENFGLETADKLKEKYCPSNWFGFYPNRMVSLEAEQMVQGFSNWVSSISLTNLRDGNY